MNKSVMDTWVGLLVAAGMGAMLFLALKVSNPAGFGDEPSLILNASFNNIGGLKVNAPVKSSGVVIGRVNRIQFNPKTHQADVTLTLNTTAAFSTDTSAEILTSGLLGEQYIGLATGAEATNLKSGGRIQYVSDALVLEQLISQLIMNKAADAKPSP
ncbi:outer membrane lipid asymmetry maintenance protein MlaD [Leeia sp.]|uniref:outer membrane lipid asymmetry maintenance protein MlaD n=1 Tax=Leeia sp. TaxID=2884678 RepID=UPI0035AFA425